MPELPEVHTTVTGIKRNLIGLSIRDVWTDYDSPIYRDKPVIKNRTYFENQFKPLVIGKKIISSRRMGKNILIDLSNKQTILIHMKMTGHLLYGKYRKLSPSERMGRKDTWEADEEGPLKDPFNRFIHLVFSLSNKKHLVLSDVRKFAKVTIIPTKEIKNDLSLGSLGPEPLEKNFSFKKFKDSLDKKSNSPIKQVLMDQQVISGIGNIYSDEILWKAGVNPRKKTGDIKKADLKKMYDAVKVILKDGIKHGGDSLSDYRNIKGEKGGYQKLHKAYRQTGKPCPKKSCKGKIVRTKITGRSAHFCNIHQKI